MGAELAQKYKKVDPRIWNDEKFRALSPGEKLTAFYVFTAQSNRCGLFVYSNAMAVEQMGIAQENYEKAFKNVLKTLGWMYDEASRVVYLPTWWKYNPPENPKHLKGCLEDLHDVPKTCLLQEFKNNLKWMPTTWEEIPKKIIDSYCIAIAKAMPYHKHKHEHKHDQELEAAPLADEVGEDGQKLTADTVYRAYPKHVEPEPSKKAVLSAISVIRKRGTPTPWAWLLGRVQTYSNARRQLAERYPGCERFVPAMHRWLKKGRYDEDDEVWASEVPGFAVGRNNGKHNGNENKTTLERLKL